MGVIKSAVGDAVLTSMWVFIAPFLGVLTSIIASYVGIEPRSVPALFITINLATLRLLTFSFIGALLGGASFNPNTTVSLYAAGLKSDMSLVSMAVRFPAQAAGGAGGATAMKILQALPRKYHHMLKGPTLNVDLHTGAVVGFLYCLALLLVMTKGPKNFLLKIWLLAWARAVVGGEKSEITATRLQEEEMLVELVQISSL
ncbi:aquaporin SIP1-1 isoform X2 [Ricinus communis]|uniref:aquaporin SIP1-1 isoform X2 n=1 Tax=Ricinus communis TaxID=3988 RepID=UPI00077285FA|nr:aquaporin SIP1-1 isoform X2 [Ricinus communis]|eukprot:XP_015578251.1 aquaporin SIP1-1 isoform X3 [Ricinus communis]